MARRKKALVTWQDGSTNSQSDNYHEIKGGQSYQDWLALNATNTPAEGRRGSRDEALEPISANPDSLSDEDVAEANLVPEVSPHASGEEILMGEAVARLTPQQQKVWVLCMQMGKTQEDAAKILKITHQTVNQHLQYAIKHVTEYCQKNMYRLNTSEHNEGIQ